MAEEKLIEKKVVVVSQLPTQQVKEFEEEGIQYECITIEEALTKILSNITELNKRL